MSKPYFTKYLPVEGEIKEGDHVVDPTIAPKDGLDYISGDKFINDLGDEVHLPMWRERFKFKKQKLFLCNRNIQVGDKITNGILHQTLSEFQNKDEHIRNGWFKVIGEISPDATWVKEGDEFDEEDLRFWKNLSSGLKNQGGFVIDPKIRPDWQEWVTEVQIKCKCCNKFS